MTYYFVLALFSFMPAAVAINCYVNYNGISLQEGVQNHTSQTCAPGVITCTKTLDLNQKLYTKGCGNLYQNCTNPQQGNVPVSNVCYNSSLSTTACCCNTENCNPAASYSLYYVFGSVGALFLARMF